MTFDRHFSTYCKIMDVQYITNSSILQFNYYFILHITVLSLAQSNSKCVGEIF